MRIAASLLVLGLASVSWASADDSNARLPLEAFHLSVSSTGPAAEAVDRFRARIAALGGPQPGTDTPAGSLHIVVAESTKDSPLLARITSNRVDALTADLKGFQKRECYFIALEKSGGASTVYAGGLTPRGTLHAVSELELRLRVEDGRVFLAFPEWEKGADRLLFDKPALEGRGEYVNIGYNMPGITPHEWDTERWHAYIDKLVLAKINRLYFYLWNDTYTVYPGSELSKQPLNRRIHENLREAIDYAHRRGLDVTYMSCPTFFPKDVWTAHPELHADIEYAHNGFAAVCPRAPGAWELMKDIARSEMEWFGKADAIQIWFYDPGGCWCEKNGCKAHQAEDLARQVSEFGQLFRERNPRARVEFNVWPAWLWEDQLGIRYRAETAQRIRDSFGPDAGGITAVGAPDNDATLPLVEREAGFRTGVFLFGTNPENGYAFALPLLDWTRETAAKLAQGGFNDVFGHRLEAWTRYPGTFFMGQFLWNPALSREDAVRKFAEWQAGNPEAANALAEAILLLDRFSCEGAQPELGARMRDRLQQAWQNLPETCRKEIEYFPAMFKALDIVAQSLETDDPARLAESARRFHEALAESPAFASASPDWSGLFPRYRGFLKTGWNKAPF